MGLPKKGREGNIADIRCGHQRPDPTEGWGMAAVGKKKKKKEKTEKKIPVSSAQEPKVERKLPRRSPAARSGDAVKVSFLDL